MENSKITLFLTAILGSLMLVSCNYRLFDLAQFPELAGNIPGLNLENKVTEQNFTSVLQTIIQPKCIGCHKVDGKAEDILFETYEELMAATDEAGLPLIVPGKPDESLFYTMMLASARKRMPPKKSDIPPVTDERLEIVRHWIANGARESSPVENGEQEPTPEPIPNPESAPPQQPILNPEPVSTPVVQE